MAGGLGRTRGAGGSAGGDAPTRSCVRASCVACCRGSAQSSQGSQISTRLSCGVPGLLPSLMADAVAQRQHRMDSGAHPAPCDTTLQSPMWRLLHPSQLRLSYRSRPIPHPGGTTRSPPVGHVPEVRGTFGGCMLDGLGKAGGKPRTLFRAAKSPPVTRDTLSFYLSASLYGKLLSIIRKQ
jgi:hypothetical protein